MCAEKKKLFCNTCKRPTSHELVAHRERREAEIDDNDWPIFTEEWRYSMWVCCGCECALLEERYCFDNESDENGNPVFSYSFYPKPETTHVRLPKQFAHIDARLSEAYLEVVAAHNAQLHFVAAMGVRALLEGICVEQGIDDKSAWGLTKKIAQLQERSNVPAGIVDGLMKLKVVGDGAAHLLHKPSAETITVLLDLLEALLTHLYEARFDLIEKADRAARHQSRRSDSKP